eukprot:scaffold83818_cov35-Tisochrysis_lutea.AAC.10
MDTSFGHIQLPLRPAPRVHRLLILLHLAKVGDALVGEGELVLVRPTQEGLVPDKKCRRVCSPSYAPPQCTTSPSK